LSNAELTLDPTNNSDYSGNPYVFGVDPVSIRRQYHHIVVVSIVVIVVVIIRVRLITRQTLAISELNWTLQNW